MPEISKAVAVAGVQIAIKKCLESSAILKRKFFSTEPNPTAPTLFIIYFRDASFPKAVKSIEENIEKNHKIHRQQWPSHWSELWIIFMTHATVTSSYHHRQWKKPHNPKHLAQKKNQKLYLLIYKSFWLNSVSEKIVIQWLIYDSYYNVIYVT